LTNIGAHPSGAGLGSGQRQGEGQQIPAKANHPGSRLGVLNYLGILGHNPLYFSEYDLKIKKYITESEYAKILVNLCKEIVKNLSGEMKFLLKKYKYKHKKFL
jgi:hypothetical protein